MPWNTTGSEAKSQQAAKFMRSQRRTSCWGLNVNQTYFSGSYNNLKPHVFLSVFKYFSLVWTSQCLFYLASRNCIRNGSPCPKARTTKDSRRRWWEEEQKQKRWSHSSKVMEVSSKWRNRWQTAHALTPGIPCARILFVLKIQTEKGRVLVFCNFESFMWNS